MRLDTGLMVYNAILIIKSGEEQCKTHGCVTSRLEKNTTTDIVFDLKYIRLM